MMCATRAVRWYRLAVALGLGHLQHRQPLALTPGQAHSIEQPKA